VRRLSKNQKMVKALKEMDKFELIVIGD